MPEMDGPTATRLIRAHEAETGRRRTPIVALTANAMAHQIQDYIDAGMDGFVVEADRGEPAVRRHRAGAGAIDRRARRGARLTAPGLPGVFGHGEVQRRQHAGFLTAALTGAAGRRRARMHHQQSALGHGGEVGAPEAGHVLGGIEATQPAEARICRDAARPRLAREAKARADRGSAVSGLAAPTSSGTGVTQPAKPVSAASRKSASAGRPERGGRAHGRRGNRARAAEAVHEGVPLSAEGGVHGVLVLRPNGKKRARDVAGDGRDEAGVETVRQSLGQIEVQSDGDAPMRVAQVPQRPGLGRPWAGFDQTGGRVDPP